MLPIYFRDNALTPGQSYDYPSARLKIDDIDQLKIYPYGFREQCTILVNVLKGWVPCIAEDIASNLLVASLCTM